MASTFSSYLRRALDDVNRTSADKMAFEADSRRFKSTRRASNDRDDTITSTSAVASTPALTSASNPPSAPKSQTNFLSIPSELRNTIYELALLDSRELHFKKVEISKVDVPEPEFAWQVVAVDSPTAMFAPWYAPTITGNLLVTGIEQIDNEAASIFYSSNPFVIDFDENLEAFDQISFSHVRRLKFVRGYYYGKEQSLAKLAQWAPICKLEKLEFCYGSFQYVGQSIVERTAEMLLPLIKALLKSGKKDLVKTLEFFPGELRERFAVKVFTKGVKKEIQNLLDVERETRRGMQKSAFEAISDAEVWRSESKYRVRFR